MFSVGLKHVVGTCTVIALLTGCGDASPASSQNTQTVTAGQNAIIKPNEGAWVATTKDNENQLLTFVNAKNQQAIQDMINTGQVLTVTHGTRVVVLDEGWTGGAHIKIYDAPYQDQQGYIPVELLAPDTSK